MDAELLTKLAACLVMALGCAVQAAVGMGLALMVVPPLIFLDPRFVPGPMLLSSLLLTFLMTWRGRRELDPRPLSLALGGMLLGTVLGVVGWLVLPMAKLPKIFGVLILGATVLSALGPDLGRTSLRVLVAGLAGGFMGALVGIHGPPVALAFRRQAPERFRAMMGAFFLAAYLLSVAGQVWLGRFGREELVATAWLVPGVVGGHLLGPSLARFLDPRRLSVLILIISGVSGLLLLGR